MINRVAAKNTHPVFIACVKYQIKWLITASFGDGIMENSFTCQAKRGVVPVFSSIWIILERQYI